MAGGLAWVPKTNAVKQPVQPRELGRYTTSHTSCKKKSRDCLRSLKTVSYMWGSRVSEKNQGAAHGPFAVCWSLAGIQFQFPQVTEYWRVAHTDRYKLLQRQTLISKCRSNGRARLLRWQRDSDGNWGRVISPSVLLPIRQEISGTCPITTYTEWCRRQGEDPVTSCSFQTQSFSLA